MRINKCDICGRETDKLFTIKDHFQTNGIVDLCRKCNDKAVDELWRIRDDVNGQITERLKSFLRSMVGERKFQNENSKAAARHKYFSQLLKRHKEVTNDK